MGDRVHLSKSKESDLIVSVVGETTEQEEKGEAFVGEVTGGNKILETTEESSSLNGKHHGNQDERRHGSKDSVKVLSIHVLSDLLSRHGLLRKHTASSRRNVRKHSRCKSEDSKGKLLHGCNGNSTNDWKKSHVDRQGKDFLKDDSVQQAGDNRLTGLDNVRERYGSGSKGDDGSNVHTSVAKGNGEQGLEVTATKLRSSADTSQPQRHEVKASGNHLDCGNGPWEGKSVEGLFVVDVVGNVEEVPQGEVASSLKRLSQGALRSVSLNCSTAHSESS
mmetsp:Transcript_7252/g.10675  ORF Transcript_7252/g.10675 Transcript_7252/m.10675 type:complete len:277 (+) Transcript_7252:2030-2860(+)